jgi:hypothetical protein
VDGVLPLAFEFLFEFCVFGQPATAVVLGADDVVVCDVELKGVLIIEGYGLVDGPLRSALLPAAVAAEQLARVVLHQFADGFGVVLGALC